MIKKYVLLGKSSPFLFTSLNSVGLAVIGEFLAQTIEISAFRKESSVGDISDIPENENPKPANLWYQNYDIDRFCKMTLYRLVLYNPICFLWYTRT